MRPLFILDWDDSLRRGYSALAWVDFLYQEGLYDEKIYQDYRADFKRYKETRDYETFVNNYAKRYALALKGRPLRQILDRAKRFVRGEQTHLSAYTLELLSYCTSHEIDLMVISGSPRVVIDEFFQNYPLVKTHALEPALDAQEVYTGEIVKLNGGREFRRNILDQYREQREVIMTIGDSPSDRYLLQNADLAFLVGNKIEVETRPGLLRVTHDTAAEVLIGFIEANLSGRTNVLVT